MSTPTVCPKCGKPMTEDYLLDQGHHSSRSVAPWVQGKPERAFWMGLSIGEREVIEVRAFRCSGCGYLESYALPSPAEERK